MALTKKQFRLLLVVYCAFLLLGFWSPANVRRPLTHNVIAQTKEHFGMETMSDYHFGIFMICLLGTTIMAWLVGVVYLFLLWRPGLYFFVFGCCARVPIRMFELHPHASVGSWRFYGLFEFIFELTIVALGLFGPAKHLFRRGDCADPRNLNL